MTIISPLEIAHKDREILYPDIADSRLHEVMRRLLETWEHPVICGKQSDIASYASLVEQWLKYYEVSDTDDVLQVASQLVWEWKFYGCVAGNTSTTREVIRNYIKNIWVAQDIERISSYFLFLRDQEYFIYADAGIQINPSAEELAEIGYLTIQSARMYDMSPRVAFLSFSTAGSWGDTPEIRKVQEATELLQKRIQTENIDDVIIEGEIQFDAAYIPEIGKQKHPNTQLIEPANIFIFPNLESANIAYKITERLWWYQAIWPIIQWLKHPANDLSRGCSVDDIILMHHITKNQ